MNLKEQLEATLQLSGIKTECDIIEKEHTLRLVHKLGHSVNIPKNHPDPVKEALELLPELDKRSSITWT